jgi:hypothetical protein
MENEDPKIEESPKPKRRGRPPGAKNKVKEDPEPPEPPEVSEHTEPDSSESEEEVESPPAPVVPVRMKPPPRTKEPKKQKSKQPRVVKPPTAAEIAEQLLDQMQGRSYNKTMQRRALYSSWL